MVAYERLLGSRASGLVQLTLSQSPFEDFQLDTLDETSVQVTLGIKRVVRGRQVVFLGLTENLFHFNNTADIGVHVGITGTFD